MKITIAKSELPEALDHETLLLGFFSDERPPKGYGGFLDWRLNGAISHELAAGRISGSFAEKFAFAFPTRVRVSRLVLFGLGPLADLTYERLYNGGFGMGLTAGGLEATDIALPVPCAGRGSLALDGATEAFFTGLYDGFVRTALPLTALRLDIPTRSDRVGEIRRGLDRFRGQVADPQLRIVESGQDTKEETESYPGGHSGEGQEASKS